ILDPVAVGAIGYRTGVARELVSRHPAVIRGNASEILALAGEKGGGKGVDSGLGAEAALEAAHRLAVRAGTTVAVTGATDFITDGQRVVAVRNGDAMMTKVTGLGCTATAIIGACLAVEADALISAAHGLVLIGVAGEIAASRARGPGSLQMELIDALYSLDEATLTTRARLEVVRRDTPV
ncbi:MAG: hydroxyethylthiazole kinase, partial [Acetobacteraceae bacterium]